jgi:hypothetical protein
MLFNKACLIFMSKTYLFILKTILSILLDLFMQLFFNLSGYEQLFLISVFFCFFSILEYIGVFHYLEKKIKIFKSKKFDTPKRIEFEQEFIPLKEVIDYFREYNISISPSSTQKLWSKIFGSDKVIVDQELVNLLDYAIGEEITIYGQKTESIQNLQPLNLMNINTNPFYLKENWTNDYNSVYDNEKLIYTNLKVKKCDLDKLIEKHEQPRIDILTPKHIG